METRRTLRYRVEESVEAAWVDNGGVRRVVGQTSNISTGGVFFHTYIQPNLQSPIQLTLSFPPLVTPTKTLPVVCKGRVVRVEAEPLSKKIGVAVEIDAYEILMAS